MDTSQFEKTILYIDSIDRHSGNINDFVVKLDLPRNRIKFLQLQSVEIANIVYPIRSNYNENFYFEDINGTSRTFTLDDGSYTINDLIDTLKAKLDIYDGTYIISYSKQNYKITISESGNNNFKLFCSNENNSLWKILGFESGTDLTGASTYTASNIFNLSQEPNYIYLKSDLIHSSKDKIITTNTAVKKTFLSVLAKIPLTAQFGEILHFQPTTQLLFKVDERHLTKMRFFLQDNNGNVLNMSRDYSISLILYSAPDNFNLFHNISKK